MEHFATGRSHYKAGDFKAAIQEFHNALLADPTDGPSQVFLERSEDLLKIRQPTGTEYLSLRLSRLLNLTLVILL